MDNVTKELKTNNMKLKGLVESVSPCSCNAVVMCLCHQTPQAVCALADAVKAELLYRYHLDLHSAGPRPLSVHDVQKQMRRRRPDFHS